MWIRFITTIALTLFPLISEPYLFTSPIYWVLAGLLVAGVMSEPLWRKPFWLYVALLLLIAVGDWMIVLGPFILPLVLFLLYLHSQTRNDVKGGMGTLTVGALLIAFLVRSTLEEFGLYAVMVLLLTVFAVRANQSLKLALEKSEGLDELTYEYKKLKRQVLEEEDALKQAERARIARDVHDSVGHQLTNLVMQLQMTEMKREDPDIAKAKEMARESLQEMRQAVQALQSEEKKGVAMIIQLIRKLEAESHVRISFSTKAGALSVPLGDEQGAALYRLVQEGLTNAVRHAYSRKVDVVFAVLGERKYVASIENATHNEKTFREGFGLSQLRARFEQLDGSFQVQNKEGRFYVEASFPLRRING
ncbi:sensor histidine kinase [Shouchella shacheensis]|uniref:sensor histidine kinase n=1 Tax=Shouchella shacheensis TaxID=1649580 RepID=UPI0007401AF5|nr:histidine kinase [Shouchella shacheensis]